MSASVSGDPSLFLKLPRAELTVSAGLWFTATRNSFDQAESQTAVHTHCSQVVWAACSHLTTDLWSTVKTL